MSQKSPMPLSLGFFGGASGIGASCVLVRGVEFGAVVDCGIRQARGETLPDLSGLQDALGSRRPDVFVLTHAHLDHSGALPVLHRTWPEVPIVTTIATAALVRILLLDALKIMDGDRDAELPLYGRDEVASTLAAIRAVRFDEPVTVGAGTIRLLPAGHILGAAAASIEVGGREVLITGDISVADQRTVPGMPAPRRRPDALVVESTYGGRLHASREAEERRLIEQVGETLLGGGHVLIPAFAVGRAQEVLLILRDAMRRGRMPAFPVYADGMVRAVCRAYQDHPAFMHPRLRKQARRDGRRLFFPPDSGFEEITSREHRAAVIAGPPCCVVASSGMLAGGASPLYARAWASEPQSMISITGYQDEEAPGRALSSLADGKSATLGLPGGAVEVRCRVTRYQLSAHADADEITALALKLRPRAICLVHGDREAREALRDRLESAVRARVELPDNGQLISLGGPRSQPRGRWQGPGLGGGAPIDGAGLRRLRDLFLRPESRGRSLTAEELATAWFGEGCADQQARAVAAALEGDQDAFEPDLRHPSRFRPVPAARPRSGPAPVAEVQAAVDRLLPASSGLYKRSAHQQERRLVLRFHFPRVQGVQSQGAIEQLQRETGWQVEVHPAPHQGELGSAAKGLVEGRCHIVKGPSLLLDERRVEFAVSAVPPEAAELSSQLQAMTGWSLGLKRAAGAEVTEVIGVTGDRRELPPQEARPLVLAAFAGVEAALAPVKISYPDGALLLRFVHPGLAERHAERIAPLAALTGREVRVHPHPIPQRLLPLVRARLPEGWMITKNPVWLPQQEVAQVRLWSLPPDEEVAEVVRDVLAATGCRLELVEDGA